MNRSSTYDDDFGKSDPSVSDAALVRAARRGDKRAFVEIVARHQAMVCGIALGVLGDFAASEDAGQETFLTAWRKIQDLREPERLRPWLAQIARNTALGHLRRQHPHEQLDEVLGFADDSATPDQSAVTREESALVRESLANLPELFRLPLILFYRENQSVHAVAETLGISEDAVKQRLGRGREMLRERMAGLIETVLDRTTPNAIFTMTIAVAIGALMAPAAVAATVFTASTTAASCSGSLSTSFLTVMSTTKNLLITASLVAMVCIPVGYQVAGSRTPPGLDKLAPPNFANRPDTLVSTSKGPPNFENSALFAEWRQLHQKYGANSESMPVLYKAIGDLKDPFRRRAFRSALISEWVQVDGPSGLSFFQEKGRDPTQRKQFFDEWLAIDAPAAVQALMSRNSGWEEVAREALPEIARLVPSRVGEIVSRLPKGESYWDNQVRDAFVVLAESDLVGARKTAENITGPNLEQALSGVAKVWAKSDLGATVSWVKEQTQSEGVNRDEILRNALMGKAAVDPGGALDLVGTIPSGAKQGYFATSTGARVLAEAAKADFDATISWLVAHPGRMSREDLLGLAHPVTERLNADPTGFLTAHLADGSLGALMEPISSALLNQASGQRAVIWDWLKTEPDNDVAKDLRQSLLQSGAWQDPALAMRFSADIPNTPAGETELNSLAQSLLNGSQRLPSFDKLFAEAPERLKEPLLKAAFANLNPDAMNDPQSWIARLSQLPEASRNQGLQSLARAWGGKAPEDAVAWASALTSGENRDMASAAIVSNWAARDPNAAAGWVAGLPPGPQRDNSAESLVTMIAEKHPHEAWDWSMSIQDDSLRQRSAFETLQTLAAHDPATARQWLEASAFTPDVKATLQGAITNPRRVPGH